MKIKRFKFKHNNKKTMVLLCLLGIFFIIVGVLVIALLSKSNKLLLKDYIDSFFSSIKTGKLNYSSSLKSTLFTNIISLFLVWLFGISLIGIPIILVYFSFKALTIGMSISSIIYFYKIKGIFIAIIYIIPSLVNLAIFMILCYNSIKISKYLYKVLFLKEKSSNTVMKRYINVFFILLLFIVLSSFIEVFIIPNIMRLVL